MATNILSLSKEITEMIEKKMRLEILRERESILKKELTAIQSQIEELSGLDVEKKITRVKKGIAPRSGSKSVRELLIDTLQKTKRPMTVNELTKYIIKKGYKPTRKEPEKTVDTILRKYKDNFKKVAPATFQLVK